MKEKYQNIQKREKNRQTNYAIFPKNPELPDIILFIKKSNIIGSDQKWLKIFSNTRSYDDECAAEIFECPVFPG